MRTTLPTTVLALVFLAACAATHDRPMRASEKTMLSAEVAERLDDSEGLLDTREYSDIRCERVRLTGTHLITRHCYTLGEQEEQAERSQDRMERIMNDTPRPRVSSPGG